MLDLVRAHLDDVLPRQRWSGVEIAEDIDVLAARAGQVDDATLIVMPWRERADSQTLLTHGFRQRVEVQFLTGIVLRQYDPAMGAGRAARFDALKSDLEAALAGWQPPGTEIGCELVGGESSPIDTGVSIYVQTWATARFLTGAIR